MSVVWKVHLEFEEDSSSKFWRARIDGKTLYVNYGRIGTTGQMSMKDLASPDAAQKELEKLEREKRKKGYQDAGSAGSAEEGGDDEEDGKDEEGEDEEGGDDDEEGGDDDEEGATPKKKGAKASATSGASARLVLSGKGRSIETLITLEGSKVRVEADESYDSADKAKRAFERLKQALLDDGYKEK
jgi:predicted DNA-binding WGR domain protein